jgi:hypothetical protein
MWWCLRGEFGYAHSTQRKVSWCMTHHLGFAETGGSWLAQLSEIRQLNGTDGLRSLTPATTV